MDARHLQRRARVDAADVGMGMRRAHDRGVELIGELEIVEIAAVPPQQARILAPQHRLSDGKFTHDLPSPPETSNVIAFEAAPTQCVVQQSTLVSMSRMRHAEERYAFILSRLLQSNSTP